MNINIWVFLITILFVCCRFLLRGFLHPSAAGGCQRYNRLTAALPQPCSWGAAAAGGGQPGLLRTGVMEGHATCPYWPWIWGGDLDFLPGDPFWWLALAPCPPGPHTSRGHAYNWWSLHYTYNYTGEVLWTQYQPWSISRRIRCFHGFIFWKLTKLSRMFKTGIF